MNEQARKKARRAELEWVLLGAWEPHNDGTYSFEEFLTDQAEGDSHYWEPEAKELIVLYEEGL